MVRAHRIDATLAAFFFAWFVCWDTFVSFCGHRAALLPFGALPPLSWLRLFARLCLLPGFLWAAGTMLGCGVMYLIFSFFIHITEPSRQ